MDNPEFASPLRLLNPRAATSPVIYGDDSSLFVEFYDEAVYNKNQSDTQGRAIYDKQIFCKIIFPADRLKTFIEKVKEEDDMHGPAHKNRFPKQWAAYLAQHEQVPDGMPLEQWAPMTKQRIKELKTLHIHTVEAIAGLNDQNGPNIGLDWRKLRDMAVATLKPNDAAAEISRLHKQLAELTAKVEANTLATMAQTQEPAKPRARKDRLVDPFENDGAKNAD